MFVLTARRTRTDRGTARQRERQRDIKNAQKREESEKANDEQTVERVSQQPKMKMKQAQTKLLTIPGLGVELGAQPRLVEL